MKNLNKYLKAQLTTVIIPEMKTTPKAIIGHSLFLLSATEDWYIKTRIDIKLVSFLPLPPIDSHINTQSQPPNIFDIITKADVLKKEKKDQSL